MKWTHAPDIVFRVKFLITHLKLTSVLPPRVFCFRSSGSSSLATARIWSLPQIWQQALNTGPGYCLEVISEKFDRLDRDRQEKVLIHELLHIPKNFSGNLVPHRNSKHRRFHDYHHRVDTLFETLTTKSYE